jgi:hypothetical protein
MQHRTLTLATLALATALSSACGPSEPPPPLAEKAEKLEVKQPESPTAYMFDVVGDGAKVRFEMQAPLERQDGDVPTEAVSGQINLDLKDFTKSTGLVAVDISNLVIYQQLKKEETDAEYGTRETIPAQNEHMKAWLEIGPDTPPDQLEKNKLVQFSITEITEASVKAVMAMGGAERKVTFTAKGEFLLHQRKSPHEAKLEATIKFDGDKPTGIHIKTVAPLVVGLREHDVHPRTGFGQLADKSLENLAPKVGKDASITVDLMAKPKA